MNDLSLNELSLFLDQNLEARDIIVLEAIDEDRLKSIAEYVFDLLIKRKFNVNNVRLKLNRELTSSNFIIRKL